MHDAALEEHKRLLYVSMTRARDILVLARQAKKPVGPWMDTVQLPSFLPQGNAKAISLSGGHAVPFKRRNLTPDNAILAVAATNGDLRWFELPDMITAKLPLTVNPSQSKSVAGTLVETVAIGTRIKVHRNCDPALLGDAVHACLAAYLISEKETFDATRVKAILDRMGAQQSVSPNDLLGQLAAVRLWLTTRWPKARVFVEVPVTQTLDAGQLMNGRIDLLLQTDQGWILLDHKSSPQNSTQWAKLSASHGGQLAAYSAAIEKVTDIPVMECWLVLPVAGTALKVKTASSHLVDGMVKLA
jgi:ATP-dependent exoDNAse (exonuclease V) beta subunit